MAKPHSDDGASEAPPVDGRRLRGADSRARIVSAMLALVRGGETFPSAEQVATHAQVGLRTVFRHFRDMDSLYREMSREIEAELRAIVDRPLTGSGSAARLRDLIARRTEAFERIAPFQTAARQMRRSGFLAEDRRRLNAGLRAVLEAELPAEVAADPLWREAMDLVMSYESWSRLRDEQQLSSQEARAVIELLVARLTTPEAAA